MTNDLGRDDIRRLVLRLAVPSMLAQFVSVLYSIVDRMYIGHIPEVGGLALGGVGVCGPIVTMVSSFAFLVGMGGSPLMSMKLGAGKKKEAQDILSNSFMMLVILALLMMAVVYPWKKQLLILFGAGGDIYAYAERYIRIYLLGTIFALLSVGMNQFIISQGFAAYGMITVVTGAAVNIILDPIFIYLLNMGVEGAAAATVLSQMISCLMVLAFLFGKKAVVSIHFSGYHKNIILRILELGVSPFIIIALDNVILIALNIMLRRYGGAEKGDLLITCSTIAQSFMLVVTMPLGGITGGTQTILAYNFGAGRLERVRSGQREIFKLCILYTAVMFAAARLASPAFVSLFTGDEKIAAEAAAAIRMSTIGLIPLGIQYEIVDGFTGLGLPSLALPLSLFRKSVYFASLWILPLCFSVENIFYAEAISDILPPLVSSAVYFTQMKKVLRYKSAGKLIA